MEWKDVRILELEAEVEKLREITEYQNGAMKGLLDQRAELAGLLDNLWCLLPVPLETESQAVKFWHDAREILKDNNLDSNSPGEPTGPKPTLKPYRYADVVDPTEHIKREIKEYW